MQKILRLAKIGILLICGKVFEPSSRMVIETNIITVFEECPLKHESPVVCVSDAKDSAIDKSWDFANMW